MNNLFNGDEAKDFEADFLSADGGPDARFLNSLQKKINMEAQENKERLVLGLKPRLFYSLAALLSFTLLGVLAVSGLLFQHYLQSERSKEELAILQEIALKNPAGLKGQTNTATDSLKAATSSFMEIMPRIALKENTYSYYGTKVVHGPAIGKLRECGEYVPQEGLNENHSHYSSSGSLSRSLQYDQDGSLLSEFTSGDNYTIEYQGGSFAIKVIEQRLYLMERQAVDTVTSTGANTEMLIAEPDQPVSAPSVPDVFAVFGPDVKVLGDEKLDGRDYYILSWNFERYCQDQQAVKSQVKSWVDKDTKQVYRNEYYNGEQSAENLMYLEILSSEERIAPLAEVKSLLDFSSAVEIKVLDMEAVNKRINDQYKAELVEFIKGKGFGLVAPEQTVTGTTIYSNKVEQDYQVANLERQKYYTRDFWPANAEGEKRYQEYSQMLAPVPLIDPAAGETSPGSVGSERIPPMVDQPVLSLSYMYKAGEFDRNMSVNIFEKSGTLDALLQGQYGTNINSRTYELTLAGRSVEVKEITLGLYFEGMEKTSSAAADCPVDQLCNAMVIRVFEMDGYVFTVQEDVVIKEGETSLSALSYMSKGSSGYEQMLAEYLRSAN